jgi:hypothetical protein
MRRFFAALAFVVAAVPTAAQQGLCGYQGPGSHWIVGEENAGLYQVKIEDSDRAREVLSHWPASKKFAASNLLPTGENSYAATEFLARHDGVAIFYSGPASWGAVTARPIPLDGVWRGADPLSCLRAFAQAAGLEVITPQADAWLIGPHELLERAALVAFAYPIDPESQGQRSQQEAAGVERALLAQLPIRMVEGTPDWVGVGYYWIPEEPDALLVVTTHGYRAPRYKMTLGGEVHEEVFKVKLQRNGDKLTIDCVWGAGAPGPLLLGITEDFDGDGYRDFVFESAEVNTVPTVILSGATGAPLARLSTLRLAVQKDANGPKKLLADSAWQDYNSHGPEVFSYSEDAKTFEPEPPTPTVSAQGGATARKPASWAETRFAAPLAAQVGGFQHLRVYYFPDGAAEAMPEGTEETRLRWPAAWFGWVVNDDPQETFERRRKDFPVNILLSYFSPGYLKELEAKRQAKVQR